MKSVFCMILEKIIKILLIILIIIIGRFKKDEIYLGLVCHFHDEVENSGEDESLDHVSPAACAVEGKCEHGELADLLLGEVGEPGRLLLVGGAVGTEDGDHDGDEGVDVGKSAESTLYI